MIYILRSLAGLGFFLIAGLCSTAHAYEAMATRILDGDSLQVRSGPTEQTIRLSTVLIVRNIVRTAGNRQKR